jgi:4-amino-4-deoxy-L-arabinose transferase-like glycosyltransferase
MKLRNWVTPLTVGSFLLVGFTGVLMLFGYRSGSVNALHEAFSLVFVIAAVLHTWLNWGAIRLHLSRATGRFVIGLFAILLVVSLIPFGERTDRGRIPSRAAVAVLLDAPIEAVAALTRRTPVELREALNQQGIRVTSDALTVAEVARQNQADPVRVLAAIVGGQAVALEEHH